MSCPSATLIVWTSAWLHGAVAADDVLDALQCWAEVHRVSAHDAEVAAALDLPGMDEPPTSLALLLAALRKVGVTGGDVVLPAPGDVRGLGGKGPFGDAALNAGQAVVFDGASLGLVPRQSDRGQLHWIVFDMPNAASSERIPLAEAEHELAGAMRASATALMELNVARHRPNVRDEIDAVMNAGPRLPWPPGMPPRTLRVLQRAAEVDAILQVANGDPMGGALSASAAAARIQALRPLFDAVRFARCAAVNEAVRVFADHAGRR